jgi:hypothetical protein
MAIKISIAQKDIKFRRKEDDINFENNMRITAEQRIMQTGLVFPI